MTMNGCEFDREIAGDPAVVRDAAAGYLVKIGYVLKERTSEGVHLKFEGSWFSGGPEKHTHHVYLWSKPGLLHLEFTTGIVASYWTEKDVAFASRRTDATVKAVRGFTEGGSAYRDPDEPMVSCPYCGKINPAAAACSCCGARPSA